MNSPVNKEQSLLKDSFSACRDGFIAIATFSLFINLLVLTAPLYMMQVFDRVLMSRSGETLFMLTAIAIVALAVMAALEMVRTSLMIHLSNWLDKRLGSATLSAGVHMSLRLEKNPGTQGLRDLATLRTFLTGPGVFPILDAPWTPIFIGVIFLLHPLLGWVSLIGAIILFGLALANELGTRELLQQANGAFMEAMAQAESSARNAAAIEAMGMMPNITRRWNNKNDLSLAYQAKASTLSGAITSISKFARMVLQIGIMGTGAWLVIENEMLAGGMIAASILMGRALSPVEQAIGTWKNFIGARAAYRRVETLLESTPARGGAMSLPRPEGRVIAEKVVFRYPGAKEPVIRGVSFELAPGEILGLIGPSAAGKTTMAQLIVGNLEPNAGSVRLDSADIAKWQSDDRGRYVGYLPQDVELFGGKVRDNIARMAEGDTDTVIKSAQLAGIHEMVLDLPEGYETEIGPRGSVLSGGQRQRVALARAIYGNPCLLVLDEPNANLDVIGEAALLEMIQALKNRGTTVIIIAHRPNVLQHVDKIMVLRDGVMQAFGPRDEILARLTGETASPEQKQEPTAAEKKQEPAAAKKKKPRATPKKKKSLAATKKKTPPVAAKKKKPRAASKSRKAHD